MTIQELLTLAIEAIFYCFTAFIILDAFIRSYDPLPAIPNIKPEKLNDFNIGNTGNRCPEGLKALMQVVEIK